MGAKKDRRAILLRAAYDLLTKCDRSSYVIEVCAETVFYDGTDCDGGCLREDIAIELGIDSESDPTEGKEKS